MRHVVLLRAIRAHLWTPVAGAALVAGAWWLRSPSIRYLAVGLAATVLAGVGGLRLPRRARRWAAGAAGASLMFCAVAWVAQRDLSRIDRDWPAYRASLLERGTAELVQELDATVRALRATATAALDAPRDAEPAFRTLAGAVRGRPARGVVLYRRGQPLAWAGRIVTATDTLVAPIGVTRSPFYVTLYAAVTRGESRAVATAVVHARPPGDRLAVGVANRIASRIGLHALDVYTSRRPSGALTALPYALGRDTLLYVRPVAPGPEEARLLGLERVRSVGAVLIGVALVLFLIAVWRHERALIWRLAPLVVLLLALGLLPLSTFSSASVLFDPTVYYAEVGGALTANVGVFALSAAIVFLGLLLALRARARAPSPKAALAIVVAITAGGPFVLRALARGVSPPPGGVTAQLWLAWEIAIFLAAASLFVGAAAAGSLVLGRRRGLPPLVAPVLAALAAFLGPLVLRAPGTWPQWYTGLWLAAIAALALARPHRWLIWTAALVAALGATTLTWSAGVRGRIALANRDVAGLGAVQPDVVAVLERFADLVDEAEPPRSQAGLVRLYMQSDLVGTGYPVALQSWLPTGEMSAEVALDPIALPPADVRSVVVDAARSGEHTLRPVLGVPGVFLVLAVPCAGDVITTVIVAPRTRLIPDNPFNAMLGLDERERGEPPYTLSLVSTDPTIPLAPEVTRWHRDGTELHGDRLVQTARGPMRAHIDIELRAQGIHVQRGTLVVLLDLVVVFILWTLSAVPEGALWRLTRARFRRWTQSYRARLTLVLFAFFVLPAFAFALWSYRRLQSEDLQSRALLVRQALRAVSGGAEVRAPEPQRGPTGMPVLIYRRGELREASEPLFDALVPTGRFLPPAISLTLRGGREVYASAVQAVGGERVLFGYLSAATPMGAPTVIAGPARGSEYMLDRRRRDLGVLVLFATVLGAIAALWLSRLASRSLARPIGSLRRAALAIAAGEREPPLARRPPEEFEPVFSAFRQMAADLGASRAALESAQRRTAAVLRNVASGVVALAPDGLVTLANPRAETLLGQPLPSGASIDAASPAIAARLHAFIAGEADEEDFALDLDGRQVQARLTRLAGGGGHAGAVLTLDDVTELAHAQRVLAWGEMARQVAHEIKNPLTPIRLGVQHLKRAHADARGDFDEILDRNVRRILAEIDRLDEIARSFSRYGTAPAERRPVDVVDVARVARDVVELERMGHEGVAWELVGLEAPVPALARADELHEVLLNLLENARLAGARRVEVRAVRHDGPVVIEVCDDGRGIPADVLPRIFEPHFSTRTSGSGLGLAVSRQLVESWGGAIAIASVEGEGTRVRIELAASS